MREIRSEELFHHDVGAGEQFTFRVNYDTIVTEGPARVRFVADRVVERRVATGQRRARGSGGPHAPIRRVTAYPNGRRAGDREAHAERRRRASWWSDSAQAWVPYPNPRRRAGDERRTIQRRWPADTFQWGGRRSRVVDRRSPHDAAIQDPNVSRPEARVGEPWSRAEDARLVRDYRAGLSLDQQCRLHGRKEGGINSRLELLLGESHRKKAGLSQVQRDELLGEVKKLESAARELRTRIYEATK